MIFILFAFEKLFRDIRFKITSSYKIWVIRGFIFNLIRPIFVKDWDINEDFICMGCLKPVLKRYLYCTEKCEEKDIELDR